MKCWDKYDEYIEKLLSAQYEVAEIFPHQLTKGEAREDFVKNIISSRFKTIGISKGALSDGEKYSGQCDTIIFNSTAPVKNI